MQVHDVRLVDEASGALEHLLALGREAGDEIRGENDWSMIGSPQYVIDRIGDFLEVGISEFTPQIRPQRPEVYQELDEEVFAAFD